MEKNYNDLYSMFGSFFILFLDVKKKWSFFVFIIDLLFFIRFYEIG